LHTPAGMHILAVSILRGQHMKTAKVFKHGNSQAVRLPKEFRFDEDEVLIKRSGEGVLLLPRKLTYARVMAAVGQFQGKIERRQPKDQKRAWR
jgi:antitoxin VapB